MRLRNQRVDLRTPPPGPLPQGEGESSTKAPSPCGRGLGEGCHDAEMSHHEVPLT